MRNTDPTTAPVGTVWLAVVCEHGEEDQYQTPDPVLKVGPNEWHGIEVEDTEYGWYKAADSTIHHRATLIPAALEEE